MTSHERTTADKEEMNKKVSDDTRKSGAGTHELATDAQKEAKKNDDERNKNRS